MQGKLVSDLCNVVIAAAAIAFTGSITYLWSHEKGIEELRDDARTRLGVANAALHERTDKYSYLPELVAIHPVVARTLLNSNDPLRVQEGNRFLQHINASAESSVIYLIDRNGTTVASSNWRDRDSFVGQNYAFRPYFQHALHDGHGRFYAIGTHSGIPGYFLAHAVRDGETTIGVLAVKIDLDSLDGMSDKKTEITVTDENGITFLSTVPDWRYRPMTQLDSTAQNQVAHTHQYDGVLKNVLPLTMSRVFDDDEYIASVKIPNGNGNAQSVDYLIRSEKFPSSEWSIHIFVPTRTVDLVAVRIAVLTVLIGSLLMLAVLYLLQTRSRNSERERSRLALQEAHRTLELQHKELADLSEDLRIVSMTDALTGAFNRRYFLEAVNALCSSMRKNNAPLSIMMIDVDYFKRINDLYGHPCGDKVLQLLTEKCHEILRSADVFARFGGEEFIVAFPDTDENRAQQIAERLRTGIMQCPFDVNGQTLSITISCGISRYRPNESGMDDTIRRADEALYQAKSNGRNQVAVHI